MFWRKKDFWTKERNELYGAFSFAKPDKIPMWKDEEIVLITGFNESLRKVENLFSLLEKKLDLILKELGKEYMPEKDTKEPAKLVDKSPDWSKLITTCGSGDWTLASAGPTPIKSKKKGKTTKKSK